MAVRLDGQVALVTGAGRGLGRAYALDLAAHGAKVIVNDLGGSVAGEGADEGPAAAVAGEIRAAGGEAIHNKGDVGDYEACYEMVKLAIDTWGRLDALICNAGILRDRALHNMTEEEWDLVIRTHLKQCYNLLHHAWPVFRQQSYGRVVLATSSSGLIGNFGQANYGAAKAGMFGLMNVAKLEGEKYNVMVNLISPGAMTRMTEGLQPPGTDIEERRQVMGPHLVAPAVTFLASPQCRESGVVFEAAGGHYATSFLVHSPGLDFDPKNPVDADWVEANFPRLLDLTGGKVMWTTRESREEHLAKRRAS